MPAFLKLRTILAKILHELRKIQNLFQVLPFVICGFILTNTRSSAVNFFTHPLRVFDVVFLAEPA